MSNVKKVWHITDGPFQEEEDSDLLFLMVLAEMDDGSMKEVDLYTGNFEHTYRFVRYSKTNLGPWNAEEIAQICLGNV